MFAVVSAIRCRWSCSASAARRGDPVPAPREPRDGCAPAPRAASTSGAPRQCVGARRRSVVLAPRSGLRPVRSPPAGAAAPGSPRPTGRTSSPAPQVHAIVAVPVRRAPTRSPTTRTGRGRRRRRSTRGGAGRTRRGSPRFDQAASSAATLPRHLVRSAAGSVAALCDGAARAVASSAIVNELRERSRKASTRSTSSTTRAVGRDDVCGIGGGRRHERPGVRRRLARRLPGRADGRDRGPRAAARARGRAARRPACCPADPGHPCDSPTDVLYPYATASRSRRRCSTSTTTTTTGTRALARHPGLAVAAPPRRAAGRADRRVRRRRHGLQRSPGGRLRRRLHDPMGPGRGRCRSTREACRGRPLRPLDRRLHRQRHCQLTLAEAAAVTAVFGPLRDPRHASASRARGRSRARPRARRRSPPASRCTLKAVPAKGWKFAGWSGGCKGTRADVRARRPTTRSHVSARRSGRR